MAAGRCDCAGQAQPGRRTTGGGRGCPCTAWQGPRITSLNGSDVRGLVHSGLISWPGRDGRLLSLSASVNHITAWQLIADAQERGPTLVLHDDESVRAEAAGRVVNILSNVSAFQPPFDVFYLDALHPYGLRAANDLAAPEHALLVPKYEPRPGALASSLRGGAYALHAAGAVRLLQLLRADRPDVSTVPLNAWVASKLLSNASQTSTSLRAFTWDREGELIERHSKSGGGMLHYLWHALTTIAVPGSKHRGTWMHVPH